MIDDQCCGTRKSRSNSREDSDDRGAYGRLVHREKGLDKCGEAAGADLFEMDFIGEISLDADSVYGLAIAMPQIARSIPNKFFISLAIRAYYLLFVNIVLQAMLLCFIGQASQIMAPLGGQMYLCDFGAYLPRCPDADGCTGPGGTKYTKTRLYSYTQWNIQSFVKNALLDVLPDRKDSIEEKVDQGEYGMENYWCRLTACFLFSVSVLTELFSCYDVADTLWSTPHVAQSWVEERTDVPESPNVSFPALDFVTFRVAGMPRHWKVINVFVVLLPKVLLWWFVVWQGFVLLMDTAGILDLVLGSLAMGFICSIDEMLLDALASNASKYVMRNIQPWKSTQDLMSNRLGPMWVIWFTLPRRFILCVIITAFFVCKFYWRKCVWNEADQSWVSKDMRLPDKVIFWPWDLLNTDWIAVKSESFWTMPNVTN